MQGDSDQDSLSGDEPDSSPAGGDDRAQDTEERIMELWPLIKVVRVQTKADVLSTGAVIVDLPGVEDSNAARAAIAGKYIEKCHGIWIVANIQRAVDDKSAQNLLSRTFKHQLQLDVNLSNITFICSKTDDICTDEAAISLGLDRERKLLRSKRKSVERWEASKKVRLHEDEIRLNTLSEFLGEIEQILSQWEELESLQKDGQTVKVPLMKPKKRKASERNTRARKRQKMGSPEGEQGSHTPPSVDGLLDKLKADGPSMTPGECLDSEQIRSMIEYLVSRYNAALEEAEAVEKRMEADESHHAQLSDEFSQQEKKYVASCIRKRNDYAREAIRQDFGLGLKELDQEFSQQLNPESFDPEEEQRDYDSLAKRLPVFCISSRAYQSLCGLFDNKDRVPGFEDYKATEMPQLIEHTKKLTESRRAHTYAQFLNSFLQTMNSLHIWISQDGGGIQLTDEEKQAHVDNIKAALLSLEKKRGWGSAMQLIQSHLSPILNVELALIEQLTTKLGQSWEQAFTNKIPKALEKFANVSEELLQAFHGTITAQLQQRSTFTSINVLRSQLKTHANGLTHMARSFNNHVTRLQREANRAFYPAIKDAMSATYQACAEDSGRGCFLRIQNIMDRDLKTNGPLIFKEAADPVKQDLRDLCDHLKAELEAKTAKMLDNLATDYSSVIVGRSNTRESKIVREEVSLLLEDLDNMFEHVLRASGVVQAPRFFGGRNDGY
ncbi:hypothetical protein DL767_003200 [Monosporascus sp. MG133]|nr:hypothetical protein DL767_003200 [Monosporascus sp. MG133]